MDYMVIKYALEKLPESIEIFGFSISTILLLIVPTIIFALPVIFAEILSLAVKRN